jgi:structural maintenance of chromosome 2
LSTLESEAETAECVLRDAQEKVDVLNGQLAGLDFKFADPEAKFDRRRVKGVVAKLMRVSDPATATALEVVAGGKLFQVVVDTEVTGKALLAKGKLAKRVTIVPLNKIDGRGATDKQLSAAKDVSGGDAKLALSLGDVRRRREERHVLRLRQGFRVQGRRHRACRGVPQRRARQLRDGRGGLIKPLRVAHRG